MPEPAFTQRSNSRLAIALLAGWLPAAQATAGETASEAATDEIVVVANKEARPVRDVAARVTVLTGADVDTVIATSVDDVLRYAPGIDHEAAGTRFGTEGISIRGVGGNRVAVLVDGVPLADGFAVGSFSNATRDFLDTGFVDRIEVLHGPASALYGSSAIGGVVHARTAEPAGIRRGRNAGGRVTATWHDADHSGHLSGLAAFTLGGTDLLVGGSHRDAQDLPSAAAPRTLDVRDTTRRAALARLAHDDRHGRTWRLGWLYQDAATTSSLAALLGSGRYRSTTALEGDDAYRLHQASAALEFGSPSGVVNEGILRAYVTSTTTRQATLDERGNAARPVAIDRFFRFDQRSHGLELTMHRDLSLAATDHRLGIGIEYRERRSEELRDARETGLLDGATSDVLLGEQFPLRDFPRSRTREWGAFVEDTIDVGAWTVIAGVRLDRYSLDPLADALYASSYPFADAVALDESDASPKFAIMRRVGNSAEVYAQYVRGFRAPPYEDANIGLEVPLFNYRAMPNPDLRSETSDGLEAGLRWRTGEFSAYATWFHTDFDDLIESRVRVGIDPDSGRVLFQARNVARATIEGFEAGWKYRLPGRLRSLSMDGALYRARGRNGETGQPLDAVGPAQAVLGLTWDSADERTSIRLLAVAFAAWDERDETSGVLFKPPGGVVTDLYVTRKLASAASLRLGVRNLANRTWWYWSSVRGLAPDDVLVPHLAQPARSLAASLQFTW